MEQLANQQSNGAYPEAIKYGRLPKKAVGGTSKLVRFTPSNGNTFDPVNSNIVRIPVTATGNSFLDGSHSYLQIKISADNKTTNEAQTIDGGIWACLQRCRILCKNSGQVLEDINNYNLLHNLLFRYQTSSDKLQHHNAVSGTPPNLVNDAASDRDDFDFTQCRKFATNTAASDMVLCMPLISGFLSNTKGLYVPLGASGSALEIELTLAPALSCMVGTTDVNYNVKSVHYYAPIVSISGDDFSSSFGQMMSVMGGLSFTGSVYENFISNMSQLGTGEKIVDIPIQCRSLRALMTISRTTTDINSVTNHGLSVYRANATTEYNYRIGDNMLPNSRIQTLINLGDGNNIANAYNQMLLATGQLNSIHAQTLVNNYTFNSNSFVYAVDTESFLNESGNVSHTGLDLLNGNLQCSLEVNNNISAVQRLDTYALKEVLFYIDGNGSFSVSK